MRFGVWTAIGLLAATPALAQPASDPLAKIGHIVVIFEENRSFVDAVLERLEAVGERVRQTRSEDDDRPRVPRLVRSGPRPLARQFARPD